MILVDLLVASSSGNLRKTLLKPITFEGPCASPSHGAPPQPVSVMNGRNQPVVADDYLELEALSENVYGGSTDAIFNTMEGVQRVSNLQHKLLRGELTVSSLPVGAIYLPVSASAPPPLQLTMATGSASEYLVVALTCI